MKKLTVIKLGGNAMDQPQELDQFLHQFSAIPGAKILVHGGGKIASGIGRQLGVAPRLHEGRRITDANTLDVVTMVYAGLLNKKMVAALQSKGCDAIGLTGADGHLVRSEKRPSVPFDYGFVGDPVAVNDELLQSLLSAGYVPVIAPITFDVQGRLLNTNADTMASVIASALTVCFQVELIFAFEKAGVLANPDDASSVIEALNVENFTRLKNSGRIHSGMLPKLTAGFNALENKVSKVSIKHLHALHTENATQLVR